VLVEGWLREYNTLRPHGRTNLNTGTISGGRSEWVKAINLHGEFGIWQFKVLKDPK
jgi:hypothetical protein